MEISKQDAIALFGSGSALARALGISPAAVSLWPDDKPIPEKQALRLRYEIKPDAFRSVIWREGAA